MAKRKSITKSRETSGRDSDTKVKFVVYGIEVLEKTVNPCGSSGRIYLPTGWVGRKVKVVRVT